MVEDPVLAALLRCRPTLLSLAARFVGSDLAEDVVNEICTRRLQSHDDSGLQNATTRSEIRDFERYVYKMVRNQAIDRARSLSIERQRHASPDNLELVTSADPSPEEAVSVRQQYEIVAKGLALLPERTRRAFELKRFDDLKLREIAVILGITHQRVAQLVRDAENHLASLLPDLVDRRR